ncbi:hypothetical protein ACFQQB_62045 [Nonomuraea rubra]|uniref:hypothetical protein n=1 Tax=Nonomuraea rubra TaxID=46180 RepID=UPI00360EE1D2
MPPPADLPVDPPVNPAVTPSVAPLVAFAMQPPLLPELFPLDLRRRLSLVGRVRERVIDVFDGPLDAEILITGWGARASTPTSWPPRPGCGPSSTPPAASKDT